MTLKDAIERIRASTHDTDELDYTDNQLIQYVNNGIRFVRRTILAIDGYLLAKTESGTLELPKETAEQEETPAPVVYDNEATSTNDDTEPVDLSVIRLTQSYSNILRVTVNGNTLSPINPRLIDNMSQTGDAQYYYAVGFDNICLWPKQTEKVEYTVTYVPDLVILSELEDEIPFTNDIIDFIIEYAVIRSSMVNEFDVSQESAVMGAITSQIENLFHGINGRGVQTAGYWDTGNYRTSDYGRRYR